jgi:hypothetical protein
MRTLLLSIVLVGCGSDAADTSTPTSTCGEGIASSTLEGTVGEDPWSAPSARYTWTGDAVQITTSIGDGWRVTMVAQEDDGGVAVRDAVGSADFPVMATLTSGTEAGWALFYPESGSAYGTENAAGGSLELSGLDGGVLTGCLSGA